MREIQLDGLRVKLGRPRQVHEAVGHLWFPNISRFPNGDLMLTGILTPDTHDNLVQAYCVSHSSDNGKTWARFYDVAGWGGGCIPRIAQPDGSLAGPDFYTYPDGSGDLRNLIGHFDGFSNGGHTFKREAYGLRVEGLPRPVKVYGNGGTKHPKQWPADLVFFGSYVEVGDDVVTTTHLRFEGEDRYSQVALSSPDRGRTWRFLSIVADSNTAPDANEGPDESCVIQLADGDLMCVMRVGSLDPSTAGAAGLRVRADMARAYSSDGGKSWTEPDRIPVPGVAPCLRRLGNEVLVISTGRPGLKLWFSTDARGVNWQTIDWMTYHNEVMGPEHQIAEGAGEVDPKNPFKTTAYTEFVETAPGRFLLTYDRVPFGWKPVPLDSNERNRIYVIDVEVEQV